MENGNVNVGWWVGGDSSINYYWDGTQSNPAVHACTCNAGQTCLNENYVCNCDATAPQWAADSGNITNMASLPVAELHFGGLMYKGQQAHFRLGPLICAGRKVWTLRPSAHALAIFCFPNCAQHCTIARLDRLTKNKLDYGFQNTIYSCVSSIIGNNV